MMMNGKRLMMTCIRAISIAAILVAIALPTLAATSPITEQFIGALADLLERKVIGDDELLLLINNADTCSVQNPITKQKADTSLAGYVAWELLQEYVETNNVDPAAVGKWANENIIEQKRHRKSRGKARRDTTLPWKFEPTDILALGGYVSCVIEPALTPKCWGHDHIGQSTPPSDAGIVKSISVGSVGGCVVKLDETIACWSTTKYDIPKDLPPVRSVSVGGDGHACLVTNEDKVLCWGTNNVGQANVPQDLGEVATVAAGDYATCAVKKKGEVVCWGGEDDIRPVPPTNLGPVKSVSVGSRRACAITEQSLVICWGSRYADSHIPPSDLGEVESVSAGDLHTCVTKKDGTVRCWGMCNYGECEPPTDLGRPVVAVSAGDGHSCAVRLDGFVVCWGRNNHGQSSPPKGLRGLTGGSE